MSIDWFSSAVAIILLISSVLSPIITTIINNHHKAKIKKIDIYETDKKETLSEFISNAQLAIYNPTDPEIVLNYTDSFNKLFLYFKDFSLETIKPFDKARTEVAKNDCLENSQKAKRELTNIVQVLSKQILKE